MLAKSYDPKQHEPRLMAFWSEQGVYQFDRQHGCQQGCQGVGEVYSVDTPPPTVSGHLHLGHVYSYSHTDFLARFWRMKGRRVFYPMGFDDNGLPTERLVEKRLGIRAVEMGREAFIEKCLQVSEEAEKDYEALWRRLGLSIDWRYSYRTIDARSRRISQLSFLDLLEKGWVYHKEAPAIWCPECQTSIAQAELNDLERESEFVTLDFQFVSEDGAGYSEGINLPIATTRPELLPACVAIFIHPEDSRYQALHGRRAIVPLFGQSVPILADTAADPEKGTGVVMCCTFGDATDVAWWRQYNLRFIQVIDRQGCMTSAAGELEGLTILEARRKVKAILEAQNLILDRQLTLQSIRVHERCDTPVEYLPVGQWFVRLLEQKDVLRDLGEQLNWYPAHMLARYQDWVENLNWDWCLSRQRYYGVPIPVWYCDGCGTVIQAEREQLPVDPLAAQPLQPCPHCAGRSFTPESDVLDTWATSSLSPQIVGGWLDDELLYQQVFPFSLRPHAHDIIRTWTFYTLVKSQFHFQALPWQDVAISGWGIAGEGMGKISKSRGGGPIPPLEMIEKYSADAVRYWAASTGPGKDAVISEDKIQTGARLVTKLWNVARFAERFLLDYHPSEEVSQSSLADHWILARLGRLVERVSGLLLHYDYAAAKAEIESFFWRDLADNYLEMCKQRLYAGSGPGWQAARATLYQLLLTTLKLLAPFLPYVTEAIYQDLFAAQEGCVSIHLSNWPVVQPSWADEEAEALGEILVAVATAVRRYKSEQNLSLGTELAQVQLTGDWTAGLALAVDDLMSITRARKIELVTAISPGLALEEMEGLQIGIER